MRTEKTANKKKKKEASNSKQFQYSSVASRRPGVSEAICCNFGLFYMFQPVGPGLH